MSLSAHPRRAVLIYSLVAAVLALSAAEARADLRSVAEAAVMEAGEHVVSSSAMSVLTIPEPGILVSLFGGVGVLLGLQRFRRRG